jgi:P4 family phage/plasmid primase-like protien
MATTLDSFLKPYKLSKESNQVYTHTKLAGGKYCVPKDKLDEFFEIYHTEVFENDKDSTLTEANSKITQIKIDLDFKYTTEDNIARRIYDQETVDEVLKLYIKNIHEYLHVAKSNMVVFVMEKSGASYDPKSKIDQATGLKIIRDGIHIMFPGITTHSNIAFKVRDGVLGEINNMFDKYKFCNNYKEVVDESVIFRNNWFLYGSTKPNQSAYLVTRAIRYEINDEGQISLQEFPVGTYSTKQYVRMFSILNRDSLPWKLAIKSQYLSIVEEDGSVSKNEYERHKEESRKRGKKAKKRSTEDLEFIKKLVALLSENRSAEYKPWIELGWCLHNLHNADDTLLDLWIDFSKKAPQYADEADEKCRDLWPNMRDEGMELGTLIHWVKMDNPDGYKLLMDDDINRIVRVFITKNKLEHNDIGKIYYKKNKHQYIAICKNKSKYVWYKYENHRWSELGSHSKLRKDLSDDISLVFNKQAEYFTGEATKIGSEDPNYSSFQEFGMRALKISQKLKQTAYKNNVLTECQDEFVDEAKNFIDKMDENVYLIGCNNGIYDLQRMEFRDGRPDDLVTMSTKIDYDHDFNWSDQRIIDIMEFISKVLPNKNVREYVLQIFASCLDGSTKREKLYVFSGSGGNGKSKLIELLDKALGDYSKGVSIALLTKKRADSNAAQPELAMTKGRRVIKFQEAEEGSKINTGLMKELTGGDKITCRGLFQDPIEFKPQFTPFLICNDKPELPPHDDGTWRRIRLIDFISRFVPDESDVDPSKNVFQIDYDLSEKINTWGDAFFWILTEYYKKYRAAGSEIKDPEEVMKYTNDYRKQNNIFNTFFNDCIIKNSLNDLFYLNDAFREYKVWFKENFQGTGQKLQKKDELQRYFTKKLGEPHDTNDFIHKTANQITGTCWLGYQLKPYYGGTTTNNTANNTGATINLIDELDK